MDEETFKVYCLVWTGTGTVARNACFTDKKRAEECTESANEKMRWWRKLGGHRWVLITLTVKTGKIQKSEVVLSNEDLG